MEIKLHEKLQQVSTQPEPNDYKLIARLREIKTKVNVNLTLKLPT